MPFHFYLIVELMPKVSFSHRTLSVAVVVVVVVVVTFDTFFFYYRTNVPISIKLGTKHPLVIDIKVCLNERYDLFQGELIAK